MNNVRPQTYEDFLELAGEGSVVPVVKRVMADLQTPVAAYLKIERLSPYSFLLESVEGGEKVARYSFLGFDPEIIGNSAAMNYGICCLHLGRWEEARAAFSGLVEHPKYRDAARQGYRHAELQKKPGTR